MYTEKLYVQAQIIPNSSTERQFTTKLHSQPRGISNCQCLWDRGSVLFRHVDRDKFSVLQEKPTHPRIYGQHKLALRVDKINTNLGGQERGVYLGRVLGGWVNTVQNMFCEILEELIKLYFKKKIWAAIKIVLFYGKAICLNEILKAVQIYVLALFNMCSELKYHGVHSSQSAHGGDP